MSLKNDMTGAALLFDWLGDSGAVQPLVAELRSRRCLYGDGGKPCPMNLAPNWWERHIKEPIAQWIKGELELKANMDLTIEDEDKLNMCQCCGCAIRLKIWCKRDLLRSHIPQEQVNKTPPWCWIRQELQ